jgi:hypothetical protein
MSGLLVTDANNATQEVSADNEVGGPLRQRMKMSFGVNGEFRDVSDADPMPARAFARMPIVSATFTRPANATVYAALDAVSDNASAGSVTPLAFQIADINDAPVTLYRFLCRTTDTGPGTGAPAPAFKLYLYNQAPTAGAGDNAAWSPTSMAGYIGSFTSGAFEAFSDGSVGIFVPEKGTMIQTKPVSGGKNIYGLLQTVTGFTPSGSSTVWTFTAEGQQGR